MKKEAIIVGWINKGKPADCGETMKNQLCIKKLESFGVKCYQIDFKNWRKHPWVFLQLGWYMLSKRKATLIFSTSVKNVYPLMKVMKKIKWKGNTVNWVIGGNLGQQVQDGVFDADVIGFIKHTLVESSLMVDQLTGCGVIGVRELPNFKPIDYFPKRPQKYPNSNRPLRLVFLSRIMPDKGCDYILEAARLLNEEGLEEKYSIDFYGKIADEYKDEFETKITLLSNVSYQGFLNLRENEGYDSLSNYDLMLFPTYWRGEGFAGVFIDSFIAGLPIIATDWAHNRMFLEEGKTALFIPVHDVLALKASIKDSIEGKYDLAKMSLNCQNEANRYNVDNVVTEQLLSEIGVI